MCDYFWQRMDSSSADQGGGDLADIVRSVGGAAPSRPPSDTASWQFLADRPAASSFQNQLSTDDLASAGDGFGGLRDPLLNELARAAFFVGGCGGGGGASEISGSDCGGSSSSSVAAAAVGDELRRRPCSSNLFSRVLQISPAKPSPLSPRAMKPLPTVADDVVKLEHGVQISSPRTAGIKRRLHKGLDYRGIKDYRC